MSLRRRHNISGTRPPEIGHKAYMKNSADIDCSGNLTIGENVWILDDVLIITHKHNAQNPEPIATDLIIEDNVTIYARAIITPNCQHIGHNSRIAAGAVVFDDIQPNSLMVGNPAIRVKDLSKQRLDFL